MWQQLHKNELGQWLDACGDVWSAATLALDGSESPQDMDQVHALHVAVAGSPGSGQLLRFAVRPRPSPSALPIALRV